MVVCVRTFSFVKLNLNSYVNSASNHGLPFRMVRKPALWACNHRQIQTLVTSTACSKTNEAVKPAEVLVENDLKGLYEDVRTVLSKTQPELKMIAQYYFDGQGKAIRPVITMCMAKAVNYHLDCDSLNVVNKQRKVAQIVEMIHTASLVHDDVIDKADSRRGKPSINVLWGQRKSIMAGDFILSVASGMLARLNNEQVVVLLSQVLADLVQGEFMQLGARENESERFTHYLNKTFKKTASLIAYSCQAVSVLSGASSDIQSSAFEFGRQVGMAFQLVDDLLDFVATSAQLGKPAAADLRLGLATAPVLFAAQKFPELNGMIMRRFSNSGDVERAFELIVQSDGLKKTKELARQYCDEAIHQLQQLTVSPYQQALVHLTHHVLHRMK